MGSLSKEELVGMEGDVYFECPIPEITSERVSGMCTDAICYAGEIHRLDILSIVIGVFAVAVAVGTFLHWGYLNRQVRIIAEREARDETNEIAPKLISKHLEKDNCRVINDVVMSNAYVLANMATAIQARLSAEDDEDIDDLIESLGDEE